MNCIKIKRFFGVNKVIHLLALVSVVIIFLIKFILDDIPELFEGGAELGTILYQLGLAYISSYIFYIIVIHCKYVKERIRIDPYIASKTGSVVGAINIIFFEMFKSTGDDVDVNKLTEDQIKKIVTKINPNDHAPEAYIKIHPQVSSWWTFFIHWKEETKKRIDAIFRNSQYLEAQHIRLLLKIQENSFFDTLEFIDKLPGGITNKDCSQFSDSLIRLYKSSQDLKDYCYEYFGASLCEYYRD